MNWVRIHTHDTADLWFGGPAGAVGRPYYRVDVTLMAGAMSKVQRAEVAELMASAVWPREEAR
jgi:hypothetical protein